jgi:hypothetical protein
MIIKVLIQDLKKKRPIKERLIFYKNMIKSYSAALLKEYKSIFNYFDKDYRATQKKIAKQKIVIKDLQNGMKLLRYLEKKWDKESNQKIKQRWLDFAKSGQIRKNELDQLEKEIENWRKTL